MKAVEGNMKHLNKTAYKTEVWVIGTTLIKYYDQVLTALKRKAKKLT